MSQTTLNNNDDAANEVVADMTARKHNLFNKDKREEVVIEHDPDALLEVKNLKKYFPAQKNFFGKHIFNLALN